MDKLLIAWQSVTLGQGVVVAVTAWMLIRLTEVVVDGVRVLLGRRPRDVDAELSSQVERVGFLLEQLGQSVENWGHDVHQAVDAIRTDLSDERAEASAR